MWKQFLLSQGQQEFLLVSCVVIMCVEQAILPDSQEPKYTEQIISAAPTVSFTHKSMSNYVYCHS